MKDAEGCDGANGPEREIPLAWSVAMMLVLGTPQGIMDVVRLVIVMLVDVVCVAICVVLMFVALLGVMLLCYAYPYQRVSFWPRTPSQIRTGAMRPSPKGTGRSGPAVRSEFWQLVPPSSGLGAAGSGKPPQTPEMRTPQVPFSRCRGGPGSPGTWQIIRKQALVRFGSRACQIFTVR